jgi:hypothetical protein
LGYRNKSRAVRYAIGPGRLYLDWVVQLLLGSLAAAGFALRFSPTVWLVPALLLIGWQLCSGGELRWQYRLVSRDRILLAQLVCLLAVPFLRTTYGLLSWLPALTAAGVHLLRSRQEYATVLRRSRRFWDL